MVAFTVGDSGPAANWVPTRWVSRQSLFVCLLRVGPNSAAGFDCAYRDVRRGGGSVAELAVSTEAPTKNRALAGNSAGVQVPRCNFLESLRGFDAYWLRNDGRGTADADSSKIVVTPTLRLTARRNSARVFGTRRDAIKRLGTLNRTWYQLVNKISIAELA